MFKKRQTFNDVASDDVKRVRREINAAAQELLLDAAGYAVQGRIRFACKAQQEAADLRSLAISIPLDMIAAGL